MINYVKDVNFINVGKGINSSALSYNGYTNIALNTMLKDMTIIKAFVKQVKSDGLDIIVSTNYQEVYDEIL